MDRSCLGDGALLALPLDVDLHELEGSLHELAHRMGLVGGQHVVVRGFNLHIHTYIHTLREMREKCMYGRVYVTCNIFHMPST